MGSSESTDQVSERVGDGFDKRRGHADRQGHTERIAKSRGIFNNCPPLGTGNLHAQQAVGARERGEFCREILVKFRATSLQNFVTAQRPKNSHGVDNVFDRLGEAVVGEPLQFEFGLLDNTGVEKLAKLRSAQKLGEQSRVERQSGSAPFRERRIALVHEGRNIAEQHRPRERRRARSLGFNNSNAALRDEARELRESGQVVNVLQHLAHGLEHNRKTRILAGHLKKLGCPLPLLPQRRTFARVVARHEQCPRRALAKAGREQRGAANLARHNVAELFRLENKELGAG